MYVYSRNSAPRFRHVKDRLSRSADHVVTGSVEMDVKVTNVFFSLNLVSLEVSSFVGHVFLSVVNTLNSRIARRLIFRSVIQLYSIPAS